MIAAIIAWFVKTLSPILVPILGVCCAVLFGIVIVQTVRIDGIHFKVFGHDVAIVQGLAPELAAARAALAPLQAQVTALSAQDAQQAAVRARETAQATTSANAAAAACNSAVTKAVRATQVIERIGYDQKPHTGNTPDPNVVGADELRLIYGQPPLPQAGSPGSVPH